MAAPRSPVFKVVRPASQGISPVYPRKDCAPFNDYIFGYTDNGPLTPPTSPIAVFFDGDPAAIVYFNGDPGNAVTFP